MSTSTTQAILPTTQNNFDWAAGQLQGHGKTRDNPGMPRNTELFPASRDLFSVVFAELTGAWKRELCLGSKHTVFSTRHVYLATKPSRDTCTLSTRSNAYGSLNDSRVTVNECAGDSEPKYWSANNTGSMRFVRVVSSSNTTEKRPLLAGKLN